MTVWKLYYDGMMKNASMMVTYDIQLIPSHGRALMKELGMEPRTYYERPVLDEINALGDFKESKTYKAGKCR
ncbi:hypothetical protein E2562_009447 [Oryza meyeriana var. granulata]|uniref:Uncharacterized protein n=1 Tax=Oryza meyeriana var. granulata TaxID=110450 RepID=A0A6G1BTF1_9ORYZ|nr:hypothetical protein E2562_009447 [Oryza meyeriana var. granulata]